MSNETVHCNTCNLDFKNDKLYKKHANTSRHILHATNSDIITFRCVCGKTYSYHQSLHVHRKQCVQYQKLKTENLTQFESVTLQVEHLQIEKKEMRDKLILYEKKHENMKVQIAKEREEMKAQIAKLLDKQIERSTNANFIVPTCICGKSFSYNQSLRSHQKSCELYQTSDKESAPSDNTTISSHVQENNDLRKRMESFELELGELRAQFASTPEHDGIKAEIKAKRKKINKDTRKRIADKQENTCGGCTLVLSPYFEIDHIIGLQFGGTDEESNLMALCCECHAIKSIKENQRRKRIKDAILNILNEDIPI